MFKQIKYGGTFWELEVEFVDLLSESGHIKSTSVANLTIRHPHYEYTTYHISKREDADEFVNGTYSKHYGSTTISENKEYLVIKSQTAQFSFHIPVKVARKIHKFLMKAYDLCEN